MRLLKSLLIVVLLTANLWADGGSLYTRKGVGDLYFALNARRFALGGGGIALNNITDISNLNPAGWNAIKKTRFEIGMIYNGLNLSNTGTSVDYSQANLAGFTFAVPIDTTSGITLVAGMAPYSNVMYEVVTKDTDPLIGNYTSTYEGNGGLNSVYFGLSTKLPLGFSLGASFEYYYGRIEYNAKTLIENTIYKNGIFKNLNNFQGTGMNIGILSPDLSSVFGSKNVSDFRFGVSANYVFNMKRDSSEISGSTDSTFISSSVNQSVKMPMRLSAGLALKLFNRYQFVADYFYQPFQDFTINNLKPGVYKDLNRYSFGFEFANPSPNKDSFWDKVAVRLGFSYEQSQYLINGVSIDKYAINAGFSIPLGEQNAVDIGLQYGARGTIDNSLIKEKFFTLNVGFSLSELMFKKTDR